ncbi:MAG: acyl-CoA dehydrogenase family protein [Rubrivivax sp.]
MDFDLTDEQRLLQDSAARYVQERCSFEQWQQWRREGRQPGVKLWPAMAQMGWLSLPFAADDGGLEGGPVDTMLLMQALGAGLVAEPYLQTVVMGGEVLKHSPAGPARSFRLSEVQAGRCRVALACGEAAARYERSVVQATAQPVGEGWRLTGEKSVVIGGHDAQAFILSARTPDGIALFWVPGDSQGLTRRPYPLVDAGWGADVKLDGVAVDEAARLSPRDGGHAVLEAANARGLAAMGAEAVGLVDLLLKQTIAYTSQRRQFGQAVARFQSLRHRMVDMFMQAEQLRSIVVLATLRLAEGHPDLPRALSALKVQLGKVGRFVSQQSVQLHGGMGMTDDIVIGHAFKRLLALDAQLGNVDHHLQRFAALSA